MWWHMLLPWSVSRQPQRETLPPWPRRARLGGPDGKQVLYSDNRRPRRRRLG